MHSRPVWAEIDLAAIRHNLLEVRRIVGSTKIMAVVKANAYGHGALEVGQALLAEGADRLAVALINEASALRLGGIKEPIMILGWVPMEDYERALENELILTIYNLSEAQHLNKIAASLGKKAIIHIKIDTGMTRLGLVPSKESLDIILQIMSLENLVIEGVFTHFSKADEFDKSYSYEQLNRFLDFVNKIEQGSQKKIPIKHAANSAAILDIPEAHLDMVRPGILLYGLKPSQEVNLSQVDLQPAMSLKAKVSRVEKFPKGTKVSYGGIYITGKETIIASLPVGYADGYTRMLSGKAEVSYQGQRFPVIGRICMEHCMVDVSFGPLIKAGSEFVLFGQGEGKENISVDELAEYLGTVNYEIICMLAERVPRVYLDSFTENTIAKN